MRWLKFYLQYILVEKLKIIVTFIAQRNCIKNIIKKYFV